MPNKLQKHFHLLGIILYLMSLLTVSLCFRTYALKPLWMAWGVGTVILFFGASYLFYQRWKNDTPKVFCRKVFWIALGIRAIYVVGVLYYYYFQTGISLEYGAADSLNYHLTAARLSDLARQGEIRKIFQLLNDQTMGFSDQGYILYLTSLYTLFGKNVLGPRMLKALLSALMCVSIYKLTERSLGEKTGRLAAVLAVFMPQFIHYNGTYLKETELIFLATLALERFDYLIRCRKNLVWNTILVIVLTALTFGMRTVVGMILIGSYMVFILCAEKAMINNKTRWIILGSLAALAIIMFITPIGKEMRIIFQVNFKESEYQIWKYKTLGLKYADYASYKTTWPGAFVFPLTNLVEVANENQKLMNGTYFIKNYFAFFAMWCIVVAIRDKKWRNLSLIGCYTVVYIIMIAFSFAFNSERYHLPAMPGIIIMAAFVMTRFRKKDFPWYYAYCALLVIAITTWNYLKLAGRGIIF